MPLDRSAPSAAGDAGSGSRTDADTRWAAAFESPYLPCEIYQCWLAAFEEAQTALLDWFSASRNEKRDAYCAYRAAADREDVAAEAFMLVDAD